MKILITGAAGFIGSALGARLVSDGHEVIGIDNYNSYYDVRLKHNRVAAVIPEVPMFNLDITDLAGLSDLFKKHSFDIVCHLAAQAGVRYSVEAPEVYIATNIHGTQNIYEVMKRFGVNRMVYASTSSVYGIDSPTPFKEDAPADRPVSMYAVTKRSGELMAYNYFTQSNIATTCLRFFTVYGPWSRPDMAMVKFAHSMRNGQAIDLYNEGNLRRDFTYISDIVDGFTKAIEVPLGYEIINLGNGQPIEMRTFVSLLEKQLGLTAITRLLPMQTGDVFETFADITKAKQILGYSPKIGIAEGMQRFVDWYVNYETLK